MRKQLALLTVLFVGSVRAFAGDAGLDQLKQSLLPVIQKNQVQLDRAAQMTLMPVRLGGSIDQKTCYAIRERIAPNYKVNPFEVVYDEGNSSARNRICGDQYWYGHMSLQSVSGKNNFGLPYSRELQETGGPDFRNSRYWITSYFLDDSYRIVEMQTLEYSPTTNQLLSYYISSVDTAGNYYQAESDQRFFFGDTDISGHRTYEVFKSADGTLPEISRLRVKNAENPAKDYESLTVSSVTKKDWQAYELPITHAWANGFYSYDGKYFGNSRDYAWIEINSRGGHEKCAWGSIHSGKNVDAFPKDISASNYCANFRFSKVDQNSQK